MSGPTAAVGRCRMAKLPLGLPDDGRRSLHIIRALSAAGLAVLALTGCGGGSTRNADEVEGIVQSTIVEQMPVSIWSDGNSRVNEVSCVKGGGSDQFECLVRMRLEGTNVRTVLTVTCDDESCVWRGTPFAEG